MSADNGVYVLHTTDKMKLRDENPVNINDESKFIPDGIAAFRIAHVQAIENFEWYQQFEPHNLGWYMEEVWGQSTVYYNKGEALDAAHGFAASIIEDGFLEYGVQILDAIQYNFPHR